MVQHTDVLTELYRQFIARRSSEARENCRVVDRENLRKIRRLSRLNVTTIGELLSRLPKLTIELKRFGLWLISVFKVSTAANLLLKMLMDEDVRQDCASALMFFGKNSKVRAAFFEIGKRELSSEHPDFSWLSAAVNGLKLTFHQEAAEVLVGIFECDRLPGWLRGDAGDGLGCLSLFNDRRTTLYHRSRDAAFRGLCESNIEVQFWSMYVLSQLAGSWKARDRSGDDLIAVLPTLQRIAATDHRLAPGLWWPMSAEAEDTICWITRGRHPDHEAAERWPSTGRRGPRDFS